MEVVRSVYWLCYGILSPINFCWDWFFGVPIESNHTTVIVLGAIGGSGKTTLAAELARTRNLRHIKIDDCKYGSEWARKSGEEFKTELQAAVAAANDQCVIDGTFYDPRLPEQYQTIDQYIKTRHDLAITIVWNDIPRYVALWRKAFRSFKRAIGVEDQGTAPEKWHNVKEMLKKGHRNFDINHEMLDSHWQRWGQECSHVTLSRVHWPYFNTF